MSSETLFENFINEFIPKVSHTSKQLNKALWLLETTGSLDAADLKADFDTELRLLFSDASLYQKLVAWETEKKIADPLLKRSLNVLVRAFKQNQVPPELISEIAQGEASLAMSYAVFRPQIEGVSYSENEIRDLLKREKSPQRRKSIWEASKQGGEVLAPQILSLVHLRNRVARSLGYSDFFQMQLALQEVDEAWLLSVFDKLSTQSDAAYNALVESIEIAQSRSFGVGRLELGPWSWSDPFGQEDPLPMESLDSLVADVNIAEVCKKAYAKMGIDVGAMIAKSDMEERLGKSQHAFCINVDRGIDIRMLNNVKNSVKWLEIVLHEMGHGIYEMGLNPSLPWLLREPPHMITTEAMALLAGRQAYRSDGLQQILGKSCSEADGSLRRRQLIFSRWVLVMHHFERELYRDPSQPLNLLWWRLVERYQKIRAPKHREAKADWAAKYHIGLAPVYYFSYLLGEMLASSLQETCGASFLFSNKAGEFLQEKLFFPGNRMSWGDLVMEATGKPLSPDAWLQEFASLCNPVSISL